MSTIHFLNVKDGDCSIIQHSSGHITVVDVCNAFSVIEKSYESLEESMFSFDSPPRGNFNQKEHPENPVNYLKDIVKTDTIFRYIQTHPDMDHMDGLEALFKTFAVINFWDTENNKVVDSNSNMGRYNYSDWEFYKNIRKSKIEPKVLNLYAGARGQYYNQNDAGSIGGDGLFILSPTEEIVKKANQSGNYNALSYCLLYGTENFKVIFAGDTDKTAWDSILKNYKNKISNVDLLIAPHHGRKSGGNVTYLDVLKPKLTLFGNAKSGDLNYGLWNTRKLPYITNNQAGNIVIDFTKTSMDVYCSNESFARKCNKDTFFKQKFSAYFFRRIEK